MSVIRPFSYTVIADTIGPEDESAAVDDTRASQVIQINLEKNKGLRRDDIYGGILGFPIYHPQIIAPSTSQITEPYISRVLPWRHPNVRWLWATTVSNVQGRRWNSKRFTPVGRSPSTQLKRTVSGGGLYSGYKYLRMTVGYSCPPYDVLSDAQVGAVPNLINNGLFGPDPRAEMMRFNEEEFEFSQELITRKGTYYRWSDLRESIGGGNFRFRNYLEGQHIDVGLTIRAAKGVLVRKWYQVPRWGLFGPTGRGRPFKIIDSIARVNDNVFSLTNIGRIEDRLPTQYDPGTLLMLPPKFFRTTAPVSNSFMYPEWTTTLLGNNVVDIDDFPPRTYNVEMRWLFFDPPTERGYPIRGHNLVPIPSMSIGNLPTQTPNYYMISLPNVGNQPGAAVARNRGIYQFFPFNELYRVY